jgi:dTDP-4-dehydrorhamnose reductase
MEILVTGSNGQLGNELRILAAAHTDVKFVFTDIEELSIADADAIEKFFTAHSFDYCINAAAYTAVDNAESDADTSRLINATAVGYLAEACKKFNCKFIHISTDYVFNGDNKEGYVEDDLTDPINVYGLTKLEGEKLALDLNPQTIVIRTSWVYSFFGKNFVKTMMKLMQERTEINVVADQIGKPTYAADLAAAIFTIIFSSTEFIPGIYNYSNQGVISWFDFATTIKEIGGYNCQVNPIPTSAYPVPAKRPNYSILITEKIESTFGIAIPNWRTSLENCMGLLK